MVMGITKIIFHPFTLGIIGGLSIILLAYIDATCRKIERKQETYITLFLVSLLVFSIISYYTSSYYTKSDNWLNQDYITSKPNLEPSSKLHYMKSKIPDTKPTSFVKKLRPFPKQDSNVSIEITKK